jgi:hypothetical protein
MRTAAISSSSSGPVVDGVCPKTTRSAVVRGAPNRPSSLDKLSRHLDGPIRGSERVLTASRDRRRLPGLGLGADASGVSHHAVTHATRARRRSIAAHGDDSG